MKPVLTTVLDEEHLRGNHADALAHRLLALVIEIHEYRLELVCARVLQLLEDRRHQAARDAGAGTAI